MTWTLLIILTLAPFITLDSCFNYADLPQRAFVAFGVSALGVFMAFRGKYKMPRFGLPILACMGWACLSVLWAHNTTEAVWSLVYWGVITWLYFMTTTILAGNPKAVRTVLWALFAAGWGISVIGILQYLEFCLPIQQSVAPAATFANRNMAVQFIAMVWPVGFALWRQAGKAMYPVITHMCATMLAYIVVADNRTGWLVVCCQGVALAIMLSLKNSQEKSQASTSKTSRLKRIFSPKYALATLQKSPKTELKQSTRKNSSFHRRIALAYGLALFLFLISLGPDGIRFSSLTNMTHRVGTAVSEAAGQHDGKRDTSVALRKAIYLNSLEMFKDRPWFGFGIGNHKVFYPAYSQAAVKDRVFSEKIQLHNAHNDYLQWAVETGIVGVLLLCWLVFSVGRVAVAGAFQGGWQKISVLLGLVALAIAAMFSFPMQRSIPPMVGAVYLGILGCKNEVS
ncbi:O-antigen polymerase [Desulfatibacillum aliphaticivorans]|uniref:O-antigen polymerase n=2 Tax=Desulfatibacillum aliphaticivorans TaxID=218208 RepID=B8FNG3_DESAL|nr:O-antigen polymerase [Desulfatibacillum aliphaticivorans]